MSEPNRASNTLWCMRWPPATYPNGYVSTREDDLIQVAYFEREGYPQSMTLSRKDARLLAKRINQCLDGTVKR